MKITKKNVTHQFPELRGNLAAMRYPCFGEIKYDGEATFIYFHDKDDKCLMVNKYGTTRTEWFKLDKLALIFREYQIDEILCLAELFVDLGKAGALYDLLKHKKDDGLNFQIFDICYYRRGPVQFDASETPLLERRELLSEIFQENQLMLSEIKVLNNKQEVHEMFERCTQHGWEGIVVKGFDSVLGCSGPCSWVKMKKKDRTAYPIGVIDPTKERITILVPSPNPKISHVEVGVKVCNKDKKNLQVGEYVVVEHQGVLASGSLRHPVFIEKFKGGQT